MGAQVTMASVTPAKAGVSRRKGALRNREIPAFAGMTLL